MPTKSFFVYIMANSYSHVLYVGITNDLQRRVSEHKAHGIPGFTRKYNVTSLVYFKEADGPKAAIEREKMLKGRRREKKILLIQSINPGWEDLARDWFG